MQRKVYISFVIQDKDQHSHHSEIAEIDAPAYSYSTDTLAKDIIVWEKEKEKTIPLEKDEKLIILNFFLL